MKLFYFFIACLGASTCLAASNDQFLNTLGNKEAWQKFAWKNAEKSQIWQIKGWEEEAESNKDMEFKFKRHFLINGIAMTSSLMNSKTTPVYHRIAAHADPAINQSQCKSIEIWAMKRFGKPSRIVDAGYDYDLEVAGNAMTEVVRKMQWDLGSTRFEFECYGMFPKSDSTRDGLVAFISIAQKENLKLLKPLIGLKCSQTLDLKAENGSEPKQLDDLNFIIDENQNKVLLPNNKPYPGKHDVTTDSISLKFKMKNYDTEYDLDRITGKFHTESKLPNGTTFYTSGSCEKRKLGDRKF